MERAVALGAGGDAAGSVPTDPPASTPPTADATRSGVLSARPASPALSWALGALLALIALGWLSITLDRGLSMRDEGYLLHMSARVAAGEVPHRDFVELYGPGVYATTGLMLEAARFNVLGLRVGLAAVKLAAVLLTFAIGLRLLPRGVAFVGALFSIVYWGRATLTLNLPNAALYTICIGLLGVLLLLRADERRSLAAYLLVGVAAGAALLYKQSVGAMSAAGLAMAIAALAVLPPQGEDAHDETRPGLLPGLGLWLLGALVIVLPTASFLTIRDYVIHLLPIHLLMGVVALTAYRNPPGRRVVRTAVLRVLSFAGGVALVVAPVAAVYAAWGALPELLYDMFVFPRSLQSYYLPVMLPRLGFALFGLGVVLALASGLLSLTSWRRRASAAAVGACSSLAAAFAIWLGGAGEAPVPDMLWRTPLLFDWILPSGLVAASAVLLLRDARSGRFDAGSRGLLVLAFHQGFLCFQIFPRAGHNVWVVLAATAPLATLLAYRTYRAVVTHESSRAQRRAAIALCAALPLWLAAPVATDTLRRLVTQEPVRAAGLPHTRGIELDTEDFRIQHVDAVRQLVRHLRSTRASDSRMLLIGTEHMIHYASDLPSLAPESEFLLYLAGSGMIGQSQAHRLGDEEIARRLETTPNARVVISDDSSARRLIALLPETQRVIAGRFRIEARFGPYTVWRPPEDQGRAIAR